MDTQDNGEESSLTPFDVNTVGGKYSQLHYGYSDLGVSHAAARGGEGYWDDPDSPHQNAALKHHLSAEGGGSYPKSPFASDRGYDKQRAHLKGVLNSMQFQPVGDTSWISN